MNIDWLELVTYGGSGRSGGGRSRIAGRAHAEATDDDGKDTKRKGSPREALGRLGLPAEVEDGNVPAEETTEAIAKGIGEQASCDDPEHSSDEEPDGAGGHRGDTVNVGGGEEAYVCETKDGGPACVEEKKDEEGAVPV